MKMDLTRKWGVAIKCYLLSSFIFCQNLLLSVSLDVPKGTIHMLYT